MAYPALLAAVGMAGVLLVGAPAPSWSDPVLESPGDSPSTRAQLVGQFLEAHPDTALYEWAGRISRVYGAAFSHGASAVDSAEQFRLNHAAMFGVDPAQLVPRGPFPDGHHLQPIMYEPATGQYKFTGVYYSQVKDGIAVFRSRLTLLVRNEPGYPLVLASADLRDLGDFRVDDGAAKRFDPNQVRAPANAQIGAGAEVQESDLVIWAGVDDLDAAPRLAQRLILVNGPDRWLVLRDAETGEILYEENLIYTVDIVGSANGRATEGVGAEQCEQEVATPLAHVEVTAGANSAFTDANGDFVIPNAGASPITVSASLSGEWFEVFNFLGAETSESVVVTPPGPADLLFNAANTDEFVRAQVNGYVYANRIRDFVLQFNPSYPTLGSGGFPVTVNRTDFVCPGNAWYSSAAGGSINFCRTGGGFPNTAWSSVIYHEYGHHLVATGGSGQGAYGEGMGDTMSAVILDDPRLGFGFFGDCISWLRNADNNCQYQQPGCSSCGSAIHACGQLLSGCVWSTRNELLATNPSTYLDIISNLAVNSILLHTGSSITPSITIDFLTLDDDDQTILNGTPHYAEINAGFSAHNMPGPELALLSFSFPQGLPDVIAPQGGTTVPVVVEAVTAQPQPGTGVLHVDVGAGFVAIPMTEVVPNVYDAVFPAVDCGAQVAYSFSAETTTGQEVVTPPGAPANSFAAFSTTSLEVTFLDDFEADLGWTVTNTGGLTDGPWERGIPAGGGDRGDPPTDADGSGQCYVTDNADGNNDVDDGFTTLTSPVMDATLATPIISYYRWFSNTEGSNPFQDTFVVEVSDDGGSTWVSLETVGPAGPEVDGGWFFKEFLIADFVELTDQFRIRFIASDTDPQSIVEAGVDGVQLTAVLCEPPPTADITGPGGVSDGCVDAFDLGAMLSAWCSGVNDPNPPSPPCENCTPANLAIADISGAANVPDGCVDAFDLAKLLAEWCSVAGGNPCGTCFP